LMSVGKSLASGMPLSAVVGRKEIMEALGPAANVYTTAGNPVTAAAANATLDVIEEEHLVERSAKLGQKAKDFFDQEQAKYDFVGDARLYGLNGGISIVDPATGKGDVEATTKMMAKALSNCSSVITSGGWKRRIFPRRLMIIAPSSKIRYI
ncbi:aminotransferase class III-fold pyridoxal phosphate-dependent enzyme, partial [Bifidobacterium bifidum]|nr:aminotransferase class III-fold pyridoxal phosphate-dependent enzyme [Bifidobacterium bifidum]